MALLQRSPTSRTLMPLGWKKEGPGWWIHPELGGVCEEAGEWFGYPKGSLPKDRQGPFLNPQSAARALGGAASGSAEEAPTPAQTPADAG